MLNPNHLMALCRLIQCGRMSDLRPEDREMVKNAANVQATRYGRRGWYDFLNRGPKANDNIK